MKILGKKFQILEVNDAFNNGNMGQVDSTLGKIHLSKDMPMDIKLETLLHESLHVASDNLHLGLDEAAVSRISTAMFTILTDNGIDLKPLIAGVVK